jgi:hypothetical protein
VFRQSSRVDLHVDLRDVSGMCLHPEGCYLNLFLTVGAVEVEVSNMHDPHDRGRLFAKVVEEWKSVKLAWSV